MNNLETYVKYAQPVVKAVNENHNQFYRLWYYNLSAEDLTAENGLIEYQTQDKSLPEDFSGGIPMVYAQWGEETGASIVLEISPEQRKLLSPEVLDAVRVADKSVYLLMDHEYYQTCSGFTLSHYQFDSSPLGVGHAVDFISHRLGLGYLNLDLAITDLEWKLNCEE
jgi:hypothetical protein